MRKGDLTIAFKAIGLSDLPDGHKRVAAALLDHFNRKTGRCDPSMETMALLLRLSRRSVVRALNRLVREGFFDRDRHGGNFYCNQYYPVWRKFREVEAKWASLRELHRSRFNRAKVSLPPCHAGHFDSDSDDTQTFPNNNHSYETNSEGLPNREIGSQSSDAIEVATTTMELIGQPVQRPARPVHVKHRAPSDVARDAAERRWNMALTLHVSANEALYARILERVDQPLSDAATAAEMKDPGSGLRYILTELDRSGLRTQTGAPPSIEGTPL